jgi:translation initiation factor 2B subunit (eIF-2B alpha/beta/delta family)
VAAELADAGVQVTLAVDAALESIILACGCVLLGADSIGDKGVVNKIGSAAAAHAARRNGIPVLVVADSSKLLPRGFPQLIKDDRPAEDVWPEHGPVRVWNRYFEVVPMSLITKVVTEEGAIMSEFVDSRRVGLSLPPALAQWAASHL